MPKFLTDLRKNKKKIDMRVTVHNVTNNIKFTVIVKSHQNIDMTVDTVMEDRNFTVVKKKSAQY